MDTHLSDSMQRKAEANNAQTAILKAETKMGEHAMKAKEYDDKAIEKYAAGDKGAGMRLGRESERANQRVQYFVGKVKEAQEKYKENSGM
jgi:hypothetical protein